MVVEDGVRPAFGDWAAIPDAYLGPLFACPTMPPEFRGANYLLHILRNWRGEIGAVDVHAQADYRPLFRHWLVVTAATNRSLPCRTGARSAIPLQSGSSSGMRPTATRLSLRPHNSRSAPDVPSGYGCEPQPVLAAYAPFEELK